MGRQPVFVRDVDPRGEIGIGNKSPAPCSCSTPIGQDPDGKQETSTGPRVCAVLARPVHDVPTVDTAARPGRLHTCSISFPGEYAKPTTVALPRDAKNEGRPNVWFRVCITYRPDRPPTIPIVNCAGRY